MAEITDVPPAATVTQVTALRDALDGAVPGKTLDRNLLIATWNIRAFGDLTQKWRAGAGDSPKRDLTSLLCIAEILSRFDVIAIQEVRGNLKSLRHTLKVLGPWWGLILTDVTKGPAGNDERLAFLFDTRRVTPSGLACELVLPDAAAGQPPTRQFARTPYAVVDLGSASIFNVLASATVTNTGKTGILGTVGVHPGTSISGFPPGLARALNRAGHAPRQAQLDVAKAYTDAAERKPARDLTGQNLGSAVLAAGIYRFASSAVGIGTEVGVSTVRDFVGTQHPRFPPVLFGREERLVDGAGGAEVGDDGARDVRVVGDHRARDVQPTSAARASW